MKNSILLIALVAATGPATALECDAPTSSPLERVIERVEGNDESRAAVTERLGDYDALLEMLPIDALIRVQNDDEWLELTFDFGKRSSKKIKLEAGSQWVLGKEEVPVKRRYDGRTLIVKKKVRLQFEGSQLRSVRGGDIELKYGLLSLNVKLRSAREAGRVVCDCDGFALLALDKEGLPFRKGGKWVVRSSDDWLVVKVRSTEIWIPVLLKSDRKVAAPERVTRSARKSA